jgi:hypothetical protein
MADLTIDIQSLSDLSDKLVAVQGELENAEKFSKTVADMAGDPLLANVLRDFADKWNVRRGFLIDDIAQLSETAIAIRNTFADLDNEIAAGIRANEIVNGD